MPKVRTYYETPQKKKNLLIFPWKRGALEYSNLFTGGKEGGTTREREKKEKSLLGTRKGERDISTTKRKHFYGGKGGTHLAIRHE